MCAFICIYVYVYVHMYVHMSIIIFVKKNAITSVRNIVFFDVLLGCLFGFVAMKLLRYLC